MEPVVFSTDAADRIAKVVREAERAAGRQRFRERPPAAAQEKTWVVAGSIEDEEESLYNGVAWTFNGATLAWEEHGACYVVGPNQEELTNGSRYPVRRTGTYEGVPVFTVLKDPDAFTGMVIQELDGSPDYSDIEGLVFDSADGFRVSQTGMGGFPYARVDFAAASYTENGMITAEAPGTPQIIRGAKWVSEWVTYGAAMTGSNANSIIVVDATSGVTLYRNSGDPGTGDTEITCQTATLSNQVGTTIAGVQSGQKCTGSAYLIGSATGSYPVLGVGVPFTTTLQIHFDMIGDTDDATLNRPRITAERTGSPTYGCLFYSGGFGLLRGDPVSGFTGTATYYDGVDGTLADGTKVYGGIITEAGDTIDGGTW